MTDPMELENHPLAEPIKRKGKGWPKGKSRKKPTPAEAKPVDLPHEFAGLTENSCCDACTGLLCVISGPRFAWQDHTIPAHRNHFDQMVPEQFVRAGCQCGHPFKTGVNVFVADVRAVDRYRRAKKALEHLVIDLRGKSFG